MSNLVQAFNEIQSPEERTLTLMQLIATEQGQLAKKIAELEDGQKKRDEKMNAVQEENTLLRELEIKRHRTEEHRFGYVGLNDLGQCFDVSIGSKTMGTLLRAVGLAKAKQTKTEPTRSAIVNNFAKSMLYGDYPTYRWNPEKCIKRIDKFLEEKGVLETFYAIESENEITDFIKRLEQEA